MEEISSSSKRRKIEETVIKILKSADLETATEYSVRAAAAHQLSADLSDLSHKFLVRQVLESFLLSTTATTTAENTKEETVAAAVRDDQQVCSDKGRVICELSDKRSVAVHEFRGKALVSIRDYYDKDGKQVPSGRGISLTGRQWSLFRNSFPAIEEAIAKMASQIRLEAVEKQSGAELLAGDITTRRTQIQMETDISNSLDAVDPERKVGKIKHVGMDTNDSVTTPNGGHSSQAELIQEDSIDVLNHQRQRDGERENNGLNSIDSTSTLCSQGQTLNQTHQPQADTSMTSAFAPRGHIQHNPATCIPQSLVPIMTTRLYGKNYHCWVHQMEFFLKQLKVAYVLKDPCPSISVEALSFEEIVQAKAAVQQWVDDEYRCRHYILNSLSDNLFDQYSKKNGCSAKELWEELKSVYNEDYGTVRSQINKYIQFQMVDGISVLEQAQELQRIFNTITASGIWMDDNFHVSVIISKLPPSWKEYRANLMQEEVLPLNVLMHRLEVEEESRNQQLKENFSRNAHIDNSKVRYKSGPRKKEMKGLCYSCGKEGHISKHCPDKKFETHGKSNQKENETVPTVTDVKVEENFQD
ncbi:hypothetical protein ACH5RR_000065 [Cinchona calisaya]|uniref:CCHC-type domain-containing protein n=1 Tax=Cinchona calisaya TaxID=153742 RepID=A0ABD3AZM8_9GENT